ncbi:MAG: NUDIX hydrolase [Nitrososphaerota archaeon]
MWETKESKIIYNGKVVKLRIDYLGDGENKVREVIQHPGAVAILPLISEDKVILVNQYRYPIGRWILEVPAGTLKEGESPEECALRELEEEVGYKARRLKKMLTIYPSPGYSTEVIHIYLASGLEKSTQRLEEDEQITIVELGLDEAIKELSRNGEVDGKTFITLLYYKYVYRRS